MNSRLLTLLLAVTLSFCFLSATCAESEFSIEFVENTDRYTLVKVERRPLDKSKPRGRSSRSADILLAVPHKAEIVVEIGGEVDSEEARDSAKQQEKSAQKVASVSADSVLRDLRVVLIKLNSYHLKQIFPDLQTQERLLYVRYTFPEDYRPPEEKSPESLAFEKLYSDIISNYPVPDSYRSFHREDADFEKWIPYPESIGRALKIVTRNEGFHSLGMDEIARQFSATEGDSLDFENVSFKIWNSGIEQAVYVRESFTKENAGIFFEASQISTSYTVENVYWLTVAEEPTSQDVASYNILPDDAVAEKAHKPVELKLRENNGIWMSPRQADYIIISHSAFMDSAKQLAQWREEHNGFRIFVVDVEDLYDRFNYGLAEPEAIRRFLKHAFFAWERPAPSYVVLVGDASENFTDDAPKYVKNFMPTFYPNHKRSTANDDGFASFLGEERLPAMLVGRIPVHTEQDAQVVVNKIIDYEKSPAFGPWRGIVSFLGDNDYEYLFDEETIASIPSGLYLDKVYVKDYPFVDHYSIPEVKISPLCNQAVIARINDGCLGSHYVGHGGVTLLSHEKMLFYKDIPRLENSRRLPFMVQLSCNTGYFDYPERKWRSSLSELLLEKKDGGAIGVFAAARRLGGSEKFLQKELFEAMYAQSPTSFGIMTTVAKIKYIMYKGRGHFINSYHLFGDPATKFSPPVNRIVVSLSEDVLHNDQAQTIGVKGKILDDVDGKLIVSVLSEKGQTIIEKDESSLRSKTFEKILKLPEGLEAGRYEVFCYLWNEEKKYDAVGKAIFRIETTHVEQKIVSGTKADLTLAGDGLVFPDPDVKDGDTVFVDVELVNQGTNTAKSFQVSFHVKKNGEEKFKRVRTEKIDELLPTEIRQLRFRWDDFKTAGPAMFKIAIDERNRIKEEDEANNIFTKNLTIKTKANLRLLEENVTVNAMPGALNIGVNMTNDGESDAPQTILQIFVGTEEKIEERLGEDITMPSIRAGSMSGIVPIDVTFPSDAPSSFTHLYLRLDAKTKLSEDNEEDNVRKIKFR